MKKLVVPVLAVLAAAVSAGPASALPHSSAQGLSHRDACGIVGDGSARCFAKVVTQDGQTFAGRPNATGGIAGWGSADLQSAYKLTGVSPTSSAPTVAIVDAYDDPNAATDLAAYRSAMNLPACGSGCFTKVNQSGGSTAPAADKGWAEEISLDLDMVSSACPACKILLVEASSNSFANLAAAEDQAARTPGVVAISNSYGGSEFSSETTSTYDGHYNHPGIAITVSSGDSGYGAEYPAASQYVTAAGGTSLQQTSTNTRGWSETAWSGAGSGCSAYEPKPTWQQGGATPSACGRRTIADVASVADPNTGVAVNDTYGGDPGWMVFGGTSAAAPFIAAVYALNGPFGAGSYPAALPYANRSSLFDVTSGSNGRCTSRRNTSLAYLCTAGTGYDGPTGYGTPNGKGAF